MYIFRAHVCHANAALLFKLISDIWLNIFCLECWWKLSHNFFFFLYFSFLSTFLYSVLLLSWLLWLLLFIFFFLYVLKLCVWNCIFVLNLPQALSIESPYCSIFLYFIFKPLCIRFPLMRSCLYRKSPGKRVMAKEVALRSWSMSLMKMALDQTAEANTPIKFTMLAAIYQVCRRKTEG